MRNFSTLAICCLLIIVVVGSVRADPTVEVTGLSVAKPDQANKYNQSKAANIPAGTHIFFEIADDTRNFIKLDAKASKLSAFLDNKGTDLAKTKKKGWGSSPNWLGSFPKITDDQHAVRFEIKSAACPTKGATKLTVGATMVLLAGSDLTTEKQIDVEFKLDGKITIGPVPFEIKRIEKGWGSWERAVTLFTNQPVDGIKSIKFFDAEGKEIESKQTSKSTSNKNINLTYSLKKKVDKATIEIQYYQKVETLNVPVKRDIGVGL